MPQTKELQLSIERIEDLVADRLAEILIMQLDCEKQKRLGKIKNENKPRTF